ncbi:iron(III) transport system substrate-binding protein [Pseudaminobacter salicylatoxidans]|uniref:Iron(III) transport system substrate-binding protein n=1 Tax=Pseudaminobacter salicylatoxidans TaxID=93369 RepID=A0A316CMC0_PSESE|nr:ABC transporter substrate-binding protein [Pseudaminobacter salicylatoxidans]PWJ81585.1 iron(III) transport system substrate-binding protein [Pseudaminobacter salicylatoxidans]
MKSFVRSVLAAAMASFMAVSSAHALVVYSSVDEENAKKLLDAFTKSTGVDVQMVFLSSGPALSRIEAEKARPQADVWFGAPSENHMLARERDLTEPYASQNASALSDEFKDKDGYWHAIYTNPVAVGVRTDILESRGAPIPASWEDLKNPAYKGLIQMPSPQSSGTAYAVILTLLKERGEDGAFEYLKALNPNIQTYTQSGTAPSGALGVGETPIAIQFSPGFLKLADEGYPVNVVFPSEGVGYEVAAMSILKGAQNMDDARKLVDWMTSAEGQGELAATKTYFLPIRGDVSGGEGVPTLDKIKLVSTDPTFAAENRQRLVERWTKDVLGQ